MDRRTEKVMKKKLKEWVNESPTKWEKKRLITNAPSHWPAAEIVSIKFEDPVPKDKEAMLVLLLASSLEEGFKSQGSSGKVGSFEYARLFDDGILKVPLVIAEQGKRRYVFPYPLPSKQASSHFAGVRALFEHAQEDPPIFYSNGELLNEEPTNPLSPFDVDMLTRTNEAAPPGEYAMWWSISEEPKFSSSKANHYLGRAYAALDHIESYAMCSFLRSFGLVNEKTLRVALPDDLSLAVEGPERIIMKFTATKEKGIRFHFNLSFTSIQYRDRFLKHFAEWAETLKSIIEEKGLPKDPDGNQRPLEWFSLMQRAVTRQENEGQITEKIGIIIPY
jgi:hypothetical protein